MKAPTSLPEQSLPECGAYVHIPFCRMLCTYCDFVKYRGLESIYDRYLADLQREAEHSRAHRLAGSGCATLFFGGGTPSALGVERLVAIQHRLRAILDVPASGELCAELNPEDVDESVAEGLWDGGFNRLSLGIQTFDDAILRRLGRLHTGATAEAAARSLRRSGRGTVSADLMYGLPAQTLSQWGDTVKRALGLGLQHLSCYALTLETGTPLGRQVKRGRVRVADDDTAADMYDEVMRLLSDAGYRHYEVSNWALPGHESQHNLIYWRSQAYLGLGAGAVGCIGGTRWQNERRVERYCDQVEATGLAVASSETLTMRERLNELILLALRTAEGLDLGRVAQQCGEQSRIAMQPLLTEWTERGVIQTMENGSRVRVAERYWGILHSIVSELLAVLPEKASLVDEDQIPGRERASRVPTSATTSG